MARFKFGLALLATAAMGWGTGTPADAAQVEWCLRVVPSGDLVIRYGANWCHVPKRD